VKQKSIGRPLTAEDDEWVRANFLHRPKKSMGTAAKELSDVENKQCGVFCVSVWCLNHTASKWCNNCRVKITGGGGGLISVYSYMS
jgi:hypothetical protein